MWDYREHKIRLVENTEQAGIYKAAILCDDETIYETEKNIKNRFALLQEHQHTLDIVQAFRTSGKLPRAMARGIRKGF